MTCRQPKPSRMPYTSRMKPEVIPGAPDASSLKRDLPHHPNTTCPQATGSRFAGHCTNRPHACVPRPNSTGRRPPHDFRRKNILVPYDAPYRNIVRPVALSALSSGCRPRCGPGGPRRTNPNTSTSSTCPATGGKFWRLSCFFFSCPAFPFSNILPIIFVLKRGCNLRQPLSRKIGSRERSAPCPAHHFPGNDKIPGTIGAGEG